MIFWIIAMYSLVMPVVSWRYSRRYKETIDTRMLLLWPYYLVLRPIYRFIDRKFIKAEG